MAKIIVVTSGKGGVGKTTTSAAFGTGLALKGFKTVVIDFDIGLRNLDLIMGCERRVVFDFINVINGEATLNQALIRDKRTENLYLLTLRIVRSRDLNESSLEDLYHEIVSDLESYPVSQRDFQQKTAKLYGKATSGQLNTRFTPLEHAVYEVYDDFPRLVPENIPTVGISRVSYSIDENTLVKYRVLSEMKDLLADG